MLKRLIEVALPLKEVSEQSAREKSIRHGHISTLHIWWARRPLAACRAVVFASLIPDPDDPECPEEFRKLVLDVLGKSQFKPTNSDSSLVEDTPRNRCLEFIKYLVKWENSNNPDYIDPARKLIAVAHKFLHPDAEVDAPRVLDPFTGGGAIPLEALRLGCEAHAIDLNPVAHLIELCTLVYPQKFGQPDSRPVPDYIKRLIANNRLKRKSQGETGLFNDDEVAVGTEDEIVPDVEITEVEYRKNPLSADVKYWGYWIIRRANDLLGRFYSHYNPNDTVVAYIWAKTVECPNPTCRVTLPLFSQFTLSKREPPAALCFKSNGPGKEPSVKVLIEHFDEAEAKAGTIAWGTAHCPACGETCTNDYLQDQGKKGRIGHRLYAKILASTGQGRCFMLSSGDDEAQFEMARALLNRSVLEQPSLLPKEVAAKHGQRSCSNQLYGYSTWDTFFNPRQLCLLTTLASLVKQAEFSLREAGQPDDYITAICTLLSTVVGRQADYNSVFCRWVTGGFIGATFGGEAKIPMVWDYAEVNPFSGQTGSLESNLGWVLRALEHLAQATGRTATVLQGDAAKLPWDKGSFDAVITDPPYYDSANYSELSDFFYVWLKRAVPSVHVARFRPPLTPKKPEIVQNRHRHGISEVEAKKLYEEMMTVAFDEMRRVVRNDGIVTIVFAHKTTAAWETLVVSLLRARLNVMASWPLKTERPGRMKSIGTAALASSIFLICRPRRSDASSGIWNDVRQELRELANERLDFFWSQGIRGADFFISAIGPALSVFGRYERVTKLSGEEVTVGQFLDEVRSLVTNYALTKILHTTHTATIDSESRFYVVWKWSYGDAKVPADESFKLSQALGMHTEEMWGRTGVLEKAGENVQAVPISKRMRIKDLGEPGMDGAPAGLIDVLHRLCAFREKGDTQGMAQLLGQSGQANNPTLWLVAQAISEILPDGDKEKQLMQGLLNQREGLEAATRQRGLF